MQPLGRGGAAYIFSQTMTESMHDWITEVFVEQPLASPGSAKKFFSYFDVQVGISSLPQPSWVVTESPLQITRWFKTTFQEFLEFMLTCTEKTNKQTNICINVWNQTPKTSVCAHLVQFYNNFLRFSLGPIVSEITKNYIFP